MWIGLAVLNVFYLIVRIYEQIYGWRAGLDSFAPEFQTYWMSILWTEIPLELVSGLGLAGYLWKTRDRNVDAVSPREEMRRLVVLVQWLVVYGIAIYWGASLLHGAGRHLAHDGDSRHGLHAVAHHRVLHELSDLLGDRGWRVLLCEDPHSVSSLKGYSLAFLIVAIGPFMIIPNVGLNEWGHTFWFMEELFVAPLHWGFVFFGWMALGVFGVVLQILAHIHALIGKEGVAAPDRVIRDFAARLTARRLVRAFRANQRAFA